MHSMRRAPCRLQAITFDPRGIGRSGGGPATIAVIASDVEALLDELDLQSASILGISFGGFVAQDFALRSPDRVKKLVLACTSYGGKGHVSPSIEVLSAFASTSGLNSPERIRRYLSMAFTPSFVDMSPDVVDDFCTMRENNLVPESVYTDQLMSAMSFDASGKIKEITSETLVLTGDADVVVPPQNSDNLAAALPNATLQKIVGGGHMFFVEQANEFNTAVIDFLTR